MYIVLLLASVSAKATVVFRYLPAMVIQPNGAAELAWRRSKGRCQRNLNREIKFQF